MKAVLTSLPATRLTAVTTRVPQGCRVSWHYSKGTHSTGQQEEIS